MDKKRGWQRLPRGEGREALYGALMRVVAREGFDGVTFRSVASEAGVTHGLASYHFGTREVMINEALRWAVGRGIEAGSLAPKDGALLSKFGTGFPKMVSEASEDAIFQFELLLRSLRNPALIDDVRRSYDDYIATIHESLHAMSMKDDALARLVFAALDGLALQQLLYRDTHEIGEAIAALSRLLEPLTRDEPKKTRRTVSRAKTQRTGVVSPD